MPCRAALCLVRPHFNSWKFWDFGRQSIDPLEERIETAVTINQVNGPLVTHPSAKQGKGPDILCDPFRVGHPRLDLNDRMVGSHVAWTMNQQIRLGIACIQPGQDGMRSLVDLTVQAKGPLSGQRRRIWW